MKISGISKITFRRQAINNDALARPMAIKVCCTDSWIPNSPIDAVYSRRLQTAVSISSGESLKMRMKN